MRVRWIPVYLAALMLYALAGTPLAPFHGDEATLIYSSRDYFDQFVVGDMTRVMNKLPNDERDHSLRLLDGRIQKYLGGFAYHLTGGTLEGLNRPWQWGAPVQFSLANGLVPARNLLMAERWAMALLLALSIPVAFGVGAQLGGMAGGLLMATLVAVSPNLVLNGRRVMMEAPLLLFSLLTALTALKLSASRAAPVSVESRRFPLHWILLFGLSAGLAMASKHSALLIVGPLFAALATSTLWRRSIPELLQIGVAGVLTAAVYLALSPAWWPSPIDAANETLRQRSELMVMQAGAFGGDYAGLGEATQGFFRYAVLEAPQYFEVPGWQEIGPTIAAYSSSPWVLPPLLDVLRALSVVALAARGIVVLARRRDEVAWVAGAWIIVAIVGIYLLTPRPWARYYLPALPALYALAAAGLSGIRGPWSTPSTT